MKGSMGFPISGYLFFGMLLYVLGGLILFMGSELGGTLLYYSIGISILLWIVGSILITKGDLVDRNKK